MAIRIRMRPSIVMTIQIWLLPQVLHKFENHIFFTFIHKLASLHFYLSCHCHRCHSVQFFGP
jgi:hypothetical protein